MTTDTLKGLPADVFKSGGRSFSCDGISARFDEVTVIGTREADGTITPLPGGQVFEVRDDRPAVVLVKRNLFGRDLVHAEPLERGQGAGPMMGGCFIHTSDSRFSEAVGIYGAIALHDRFES